MSDLSHVTIDGETYDLKDAVARTLGTPVNPVRLPLVVEKEGVRYSCDVISDESGTDWFSQRIRLSSTPSMETSSGTDMPAARQALSTTVAS